MDIKKIKLGTTEYDIRDASAVHSGSLTTTPPSASSDDTTIPSSLAVWTAIGNGIATNDAMIYKGTIAGGSTDSYGALTAAADRGWTYKVSAAGKINGVAVEIGDLLICNTDSTVAATTSNYSTIAANWDFIQNNVDGSLYKDGNAFTNEQVLVADGTDGKVKTSGYTIATSVPSNAKFTDTKNTAGSTDTSSKIFLIGATSQASSSRTYSHDTAYVDTDGCLYSGGNKVLTSANATAGTYNLVTVNSNGLVTSGSVTPGILYATWDGNALTATDQGYAIVATVQSGLFSGEVPESHNPMPGDGDLVFVNFGNGISDFVGDGVDLLSLSIGGFSHLISMADSYAVFCEHAPYKMFRGVVGFVYRLGSPNSYWHMCLQTSVGGWFDDNSEEGYYNQTYTTSIKGVKGITVWHSNSNLYIGPVPKYALAVSGSTWTLEPYVPYSCGNITSNKTVTLTAPTYSSDFAQYNLDFNMGSTAYSVTFPSSIVWKEAPSFSANHHYEISIKYNPADSKYYGICVEY